MNNVLPFLALPSHTFEVEEQDMEENDSVHDEGMQDEYWQEGEVEGILAMLLTLVDHLLSSSGEWRRRMGPSKKDHIVIFIDY